MHLDEMSQLSLDPIAIVGMACRFPGASNLTDFWRLLCEGSDEISDLSPQRWSLVRSHLSTQEIDQTRQSSPNCWGGFLEHVDQFDATFFGITPREATIMTPQHRLLLEVAWEAMENAAFTPDKLAKTQTGVFIGLTNRDYAQLAWNADTLEDPYLTTGTNQSIAASRISYTLNLSGPCLVVDTACSSSLVAIHMACQSIRAGEATMAFAGGVNLMLEPNVTFNLTSSGFQASDGRCKSFDSRADGYVRGEGVGIVLLKPLAQALADADLIHAVILGSAVNHDGRTQGLTAPKPSAQEAVLRQAYRHAKVDPSEVQYVEAHGTGTSLGDPIELRALGKVIKEGRDPQNPCVVGTVKTNIGHLESAAGIAGLIKTALSLQHRQIPPNLHFKIPNPYIPFDKLPIEVPQTLMEWPSYGGTDLAGVSAFSFGGTNAHVVLQAAPQRKKQLSQVERPLHLLVLSAKSEPALKAIATKFKAYLQASPNQDLGDICYTASIGRSHYDYRLAVLGNSTTELSKTLGKFETGQISAGMATGQVTKNTAPKVAILFTGQGSQYVGMGRELYETQPTFRHAVEKCAEILKDELDQPLLELLYSEEKTISLIDQTTYTQPVLFSLEYALYQLWQSWGVRPTAVMGHSVGEYVAACVAGVFSLEDGLRLIAARGRLMQQLPAGGTMVSLMATVDQVKVAIGDLDGVAIAAINGPKSIVISGSEVAVQSVIDKLLTQGIKSKALQVSHGFHSPLMAPILAEFEILARQVNYTTPRIKFISNVTGQAETTEITTPEYWCNHILAPVNFAAGMKALQEQGCEVFLECGPKPVLLGMGCQCLADDIGIWLPSLKPQQSNWQQMLMSLGELYVKGIKVDWHGLDRDYPQRNKVSLPSYPFQKQSYWLKTSTHNNQSTSHSLFSNRLHPLIQKKFQSPLSQDLFFESSFSVKELPFLADHLVYAHIIAPAACYLSLLLAAASLIEKYQGCQLTDIIFPQALALSEDKSITVQTILTPQKDKKDKVDFQIISFDPDQTQKLANRTQTDYALHASGSLNFGQDGLTNWISREQIQKRCNRQVEGSAIYQHLGPKMHIQWKDAFRWIQQVWVGNSEILGQLKQPDVIQDAKDYELHPTLIDACFQLIAEAVRSTVADFQGTWIPFCIEQFSSVEHFQGDEIWCHGQLRSPQGIQSGQENISKSVDDKVENNFYQKPKQQIWDLQLFTPEGQIIARIQGFEARPVSSNAILAPLRNKGKQTFQTKFYESIWQPQARFGRLGTPDFIPTPTDIASQLEPQLQELLKNPRLHQQIQVGLPQLEQASLTFIVQAFIQLGWSYGVGASFNSLDVAQRLGVVPQHRRLLARLLQILTEENILQYQGNQWQVMQPLSLVPVSTNHVEATLEHQAEWQLLQRCGSQLSSILRGAVDPVQLVFPAGDLSMVTQLYQDSPGAQMFNTLVQQVVTQALVKTPPARGLRILEIGAGTGGTTRYLLPHLPAQNTQYSFTDIGTLFTQKAQDYFQDYSFITYQSLDIEQEPRQQGFVEHQQDVVVAANVLHATQDLKQTLQHVRKLLAPGGVLVLLETTHPQRWLDLIFGLLDGWWRFSDVALRSDYPLLNRDKWRQVLHENGFSNIAVLPSKLSPDPTNFPDIGQSVIVAQADKLSEPSLQNEGGWLILADRQGVAQQIAEQLYSRGELCLLVTIKVGTQLEISSESPLGRPFILSLDPYDVDAYSKLLAQVDAQIPVLQGVIHCWGLDGPDAKSMDTPALAEASYLGCGTVLSLLQALNQKNFSTPPRFWIVTRGTQSAGTGANNLSGISQSPLWGMRKVIALEHPELKCTCIDLDPDASLVQQAQNLWAEVWSGNPEDQVVLRQDRRYVARLTGNQSLSEYNGKNGDFCMVQSGESYQLALEEPGLLDSLQWVSSIRKDPAPDEVAIKVHATGLNFLDIVAALDLIPQDVDGHSQQHLKTLKTLGGECAGEIVALGTAVKHLALGDSVMALAPGAFSQYVIAKAHAVVTKSEFLSFEQAAAIPINFLTAYYALSHVAQLKAGERILIHSAAGGTGMAAVQIAQQLGAEVWATASPSKWETLRAMGVKHVMNSRTTEFAEQIMTLSAAQGVHVVLNSLTSSDFVSRSLSVLAHQGRFIEISKRGVWSSEQMTQARPDIAYTIVDLVKISKEQPDLTQSLLQQIQGQFQSEQWKSPPLTVFPKEQAIDAFRYMQRAQHTGKIVVTQNLPTAGVKWSGEGTYLITGGLGGLGLLTADWLVNHQVKHLVLVSRREPSDQAQTQLKALEAKGAQVTIAQADVSDYTAMQTVINKTRQDHPPLQGVIHAAGVLDDGVLQQQTWQKFTTVMAPKVQGAWNLHQLTQDDPIEFFLLFSSAASLLGSPGQANHSAANAFLDGLAHYRQSLHLPGQSLNLGAVTQVGEAAERGADARAKQQGIGVITPQEVLDVLEQLFCHPQVTEIGMVPIDWTSKQLPPQWVDWPYLSDWIKADQQNTMVIQEVGNQESKFVQQLRAAPLHEQHKMLTIYICRQLTKVLGLSDWQKINREEGFFDLGMDSLTAVELRNRLQTELGCSIAVTTLMDYPTVDTLVSYLEQHILQLSLPPENRHTKPSDPLPPPTDMMQDAYLETLTQDELADLLAAKLASI